MAAKSFALIYFAFSVQTRHALSLRNAMVDRHIRCYRAYFRIFLPFVGSFSIRYILRFCVSCSVSCSDARPCVSTEWDGMKILKFQKLICLGMHQFQCILMSKTAILTQQTINTRNRQLIFQYIHSDVIQHICHGIHSP